MKSAGTWRLRSLINRAQRTLVSSMHQVTGQCSLSWRDLSDTATGSHGPVSINLITDICSTRLWLWQLICTKKVQLTGDLGELGWQVDSNQQREPAQSSENTQGWNEAVLPRDTHVQMWTWWKDWRIFEQTFDTLSPCRNPNTVMEPPSPPPSTCLNSSVFGTTPPRFVLSKQLCPFPRRCRGWRSSLGSGSLCAADVAWNLAPGT